MQMGLLCLPDGFFGAAPIPEWQTCMPQHRAFPFLSQSEPPCSTGKAAICALSTARFPRRTRLLATAPLQNALSRTLPALLFRWFS